MASSAVSGAVSGAASGFMAAGPMGAAVGGAIGLAAGALNGYTETLKVEDEYFKSYVQSAVGGQMSAQAEQLSRGTAIATGREDDLFAYTKLFGDSETAQSYLGQVHSLAGSTMLSYGDLTAMSKTMQASGTLTKTESTGYRAIKQMGHFHV